MKNIFLLLILALFTACDDKSKSLEEVKADFGDFGSSTIKLIPVDYKKTPINNTIKHHPEEYTYLNEVNIFSVGHISDNLFITGLLVAPKKEGKYPIIIFNRGGNTDLGTLIVATAVNEMAPLAAKGYVVVATNYRGNSRSEGVEEFGGSDVNDVTNLIKSMAEIAFADTSRVGLLGISRGGMMNYLTLKKQVTNIRATVNIGGITDLDLTMKSHPQIEAVADELIPDFQLNRKAEIEERSAIHWANQLPKTTPILLLNGMDDQHVAYAQVPPFADSLAKYNIPYKLVSFQNDNHGIIGHKKAVRRLIYDWFDKYVKHSNIFDEQRIRETVK